MINWVRHLFRCCCCSCCWSSSSSSSFRLYVFLFYVFGFRYSICLWASLNNTHSTVRWYVYARKTYMNCCANDLFLNGNLFVSCYVLLYCNTLYTMVPSFFLSSSSLSYIALYRYSVLFIFLSFFDFDSPFQFVHITSSSQMILSNAIHLTFSSYLRETKIGVSGLWAKSIQQITLTKGVRKMQNSHFITFAQCETSVELTDDDWAIFFFSFLPFFFFSEVW